MYNIMNNSKSGMKSTQDKINIISNNMVNSNTVGYKKIEVEFQELVMKSLYNNSYPVNSNDAQNGTGVKISNEFRNLKQGSIKETEIKSNLAIDGDGFFRVRMPDNTYAYTRNGQFNIDSNNQITDDMGNLLDIEFYNNYNYSNLNINYENLNIDQKGEVFVNDVRVGTINLYTTVGDNDFLSIGNSLYKLKNQGNINIENGANVLQGYVEMSNVDLAQEMTDLIAIQRSFQMNGKGIQVADEMWSMVNNLQSR